MNKVGFGGGCHWCTEAVFQSLIGVVKVDQGWISSDDDNKDFSEGILVQYDEDQIGLSTLISIHLRTHSSTSRHQLRSKYRSAIYTQNIIQFEKVTKILKELQDDFVKPLVTQVLPIVSFKTNSSEYLNYYYNDPKRKFCRTYIDPKLLVLLSEYSQYINKVQLNHIIELSKNEEHAIKD